MMGIDMQGAPMAVDLDVIQREQLAWMLHNFPDATVNQAVLGVCEEAGELAHAQLKFEQGIRGDKGDHEAEARDAVGDICIYLFHWCNLMGFQLFDIIRETWDQVKQRDWQKFPGNGRDS